MSGLVSRRGLLGLVRKKETFSLGAFYEARGVERADTGARRVEIDPTACLAHQRSFCTVCKERCPVPGAVQVASGLPRIDPARCTGCGDCIAACPAPRMALRIRGGGR